MSARVEVDASGVGLTQRSRQVWTVIIVSMVAFLGLCGLVGLTFSSFLGGITEPQSASMQALPGSQLAVQRHNTTTAELITGTTTLQEGDTATAREGRAFISLFEDSGAIQLYSNSSVTMDQMRTSRFFQNSKDIVLILHAGTIEMATGELRQSTSADYVVSTDKAEIEIRPGSHVRVRVEDGPSGSVTQAVVDYGSAVMRSQGKRIDLAQQQMASVAGAEEPVGPLAAQEDLVRNGNFSEPPTSEKESIEDGGLGTAAWLPRHDDSGGPISPSSVAITSEVNLRAAVINGAGGGGRYVRVGMIQDINRPAAFFNTIELSATIKLVSQALPAGGPIPDVYPLVIRVVYTDSNGKNHEWKRSFYYQGPDPDPSDPTVIKMTQGRWTSAHEMQVQRAQAASTAAKSTSPSESPDSGSVAQSLFVLKSPNQIEDISVINTIEVYGYGTLFQSWITGISLMAH